MQKLKILNSKEAREIKEKLAEQFGFKGELDYAFLLNEKGRVFIVNRDISRLELKRLRVDRYGLYFGELRKGELRLSLEGAGLVAPLARKNLVELNKEEVRKYFRGEDLEKDLGEENRFVLLKYQKDFLGCARYKEKKILNFLPKIHRTPELIV